MDLVAGTRRVIVITEHVSKNGAPKIVAECDLPLTGRRVVDRIVSDRGVFDVTVEGLILRRLAPGESIQELRRITGADFGIDLP